MMGKFWNTDTAVNAISATAWEGVLAARRGDIATAHSNALAVAVWVDRLPADIQRLGVVRTPVDALADAIAVAVSA